MSHSIERGPASGFGEPPPEATPRGGERSVHRRSVAAPAPAVVRAAGEAAEDWGGTWEEEPGGGGRAGRLALPVAAGLRHGRIEGRLVARESADATALELVVETARYRLWTPAVAILVLAAGGGSLTVLWPFFPVLLPLAPLGALIALSAWLLVLARLQNRGPEEFLETVALLAEEGEIGRS